MWLRFHQKSRKSIVKGIAPSPLHNWLLPLTKCCDTHQKQTEKSRIKFELYTAFGK